MSNVITFPLAEQISAPADPCYGLGHRMLTLKQICEWLSVTERHIRGLVEDDAIPYRKVGRLLRFSESEIEEWTRPSQKPSGAPRPQRSIAGPRPSFQSRSTSHERITMSQLAS